MALIDMKHKKMNFLHVTNLMLIFHVVFTLEQCTDCAFDGFWNLIDVLWFDQCFQIILKDFSEIILQLGAYTTRTIQRISISLNKSEENLNKSILNVPRK